MCCDHESLWQARPERGTTVGHDLVAELDRRLDALWRYDQYIANAEWRSDHRHFWQECKAREQQALSQLRSLIAREVRATARPQRGTRPPMSVLHVPSSQENRLGMQDSVTDATDFFSIHDVLIAKAIQGIVAAEPDMTVREAAELMLSEGVGSLLVMDGESLLGILTERDMVRVARDAGAVDNTLAQDVMNSEVLCCRDNSSADEVAACMQLWRVRHLPVLNANEDIIGVVSLGDITAHRARQCQTALSQLENYVYRRS